MLFVKLTINYGGNMRSYFIAINLLLGNSSLFSSYCLDASSDENTKIKYIKVMSERCSGSYYTTALIDENFDGFACHTGCLAGHRIGIDSRECSQEIL